MITGGLKMTQVRFCIRIAIVALISGACGDSGSESKLTGVTAGTGLTGGGTEGDVTLSADTEVLQRRVAGTCTANTAMQAIDEAGDATCTPELAPAAHDHAGVYSPEGHNHDGAYAPARHDHDLDYSPLGHDHDRTYSAVAHDHDNRYLPTAGFNGHNSGDCANDGGFVVIGNLQEEFGCVVSCSDICARHGLTCDRAYDLGGNYRVCAFLHPTDGALYCWCKS
jgi:hypothetical protein